jgi:cobalt-zinc-cadmium efflux system membrane fusion protein
VSGVLACVLAVACQGLDVAPPDAAKPARAAELKLDAGLIEQGRVALGYVELRSLDDELRATGYVEPDVAAAADVGALTLGRIRDVKVRPGDRVTKGQVLAELDAPDAARAAAELARTSAERIRAEQALAREERLIAGQATTRRELEQAQSDLVGLRAQERAARHLLQAYGALGSRVSVRAPIGGLLTHVGVELGTRVEAGDQLFRIVDPKRFIVRAEVLERDALRVAIGASAAIRFPDGRSCVARVTASSAEVERVRHTVSVRLAPEHCELAIAGQVLDIRIATSEGSAPKMTAVPRDAVVELDGAPAVFVVGAAPGTFELVPVLVLRLTETTAFLERGPAPGTRIAVKGTILLKGEWMRASLE